MVSVDMSGTSEHSCHLVRNLLCRILLLVAAGSLRIRVVVGVVRVMRVVMGVCQWSQSSSLLTITVNVNAISISFPHIIFT